MTDFPAPRRETIAASLPIAAAASEAGDHYSIAGRPATEAGAAVSEAGADGGTRPPELAPEPGGRPSSGVKWGSHYDPHSDIDEPPKEASTTPAATMAPTTAPTGVIALMAAGGTDDEAADDTDDKLDSSEPDLDWFLDLTHSDDESLDSYCDQLDWNAELDALGANDGMDNMDYLYSYDHDTDKATRQLHTRQGVPVGAPEAACSIFEGKTPGTGETWFAMFSDGTVKQINKFRDAGAAIQNPEDHIINLSL